ncbi:interleukin-12 receptor subunit beta-1 [Willisornis vidua]|uniref:Interleukin-12 receptor subunit beta-1 n=1 Tax=Willisornis vidua TaxID=1566151 RepID=A0ABQ9D4E8_9PASS|nr:interleukin-12 receptor subunit beta-1 [Willisornis vidua]
MLGWLLAALAAGGTVLARDFSCWKKCSLPERFYCSWSSLGPAGNTSYSLNLCYKQKNECHQFKAGTMTNYNLPRRRVYTFYNSMAWVEARWGDHIHRTPNISFVFNEANKPDPPPTGLPFSKTGGQLSLQVPQPQCHGMDQPLQREARFWRAGDSSWTQVTCETTTGTGEDDSVTCVLGINGTFLVQLRQKYLNSYWSDWSSNISVPEEILESPVLSHQLGKLGIDGQRVLRLNWQPVLKEQKDVNYTLNATMLACGCAGLDEEDVVELGWEVRQHNLTLSGAEYEVQLRAVNAAGPGPAWQLRVPAEQNAGALGVPACHRLAVHGWDPERGWATFALWHHYASNDSLAVPINISTGDAAVVLQWKPSPRATCPGALAKYLVCHMAEGDNMTYGEVDAMASNYTLQNLQPGTAYRVGVWEVTEDSEGTCSAWWHFHTNAPGLLEPSERFNPAELLLPEPYSSKETPDTDTQTDVTHPSVPQPSPEAEKLVPAVVVGPPSCGEDTTFTYRRQEVLSPVGSLLPGSTSCTGHPPGEEEEEEEEGRQGLHQPLIPIALLISNKPIIIRDEEGCDPSPEKSVP